MVALTSIKQSLSPHWEQFQEIFKTALSSPYALLSAIDGYLLNQPGKQLRPVLTLLAASVFGTPNSLSHAAAASVEMLHTATLLHDDVADNADRRRGAWSVQKVYGAQASILLGDFWFARALQLLLDCNGQNLFHYFAQAIKSLSEGELLQLEKAQTYDITEDEYYTICAAKTASLFQTALLSGASSVWSASQKKQYYQILESASYHLGMAFQIKDDILDYSPQIDSGKLPYRDILESKITLPLLGAIRQAPPECESQVKEWIRQAVGGSHLALQKVVQVIQDYHGMEYARQVQESHDHQAKEYLSKLPEGLWRDYLLQIVDM